MNMDKVNTNARFIRAERKTMAHTLEVKLSISIRRPTKDECDDLGLDYEEAKEFDIESVQVSDFLEDMGGYFENCLDEFSAEILGGSELPFMISKIEPSKISH